MSSHKFVDFCVGLFFIVVIAVLFFVATKSSTIHRSPGNDSFSVVAKFDDIGSLMVNAPVRIAGVKIGEVSNITLDNELFKAVVTMTIINKESNIPQDSTASIMTEGLLGAKYISLSPGFEEAYLTNGDEITSTHSAIILENLLGKFLFK